MVCTDRRIHIACVQGTSAGDQRNINKQRVTSVNPSQFVVNKEKPCNQNGWTKKTRKNVLNAQTCVNYQIKNEANFHSEIKTWMNLICIFRWILNKPLFSVFHLYFYFLILKYISFRSNVHAFVRYGDKRFQFILLFFLHI